jgi:hypothetical protein
MCKATCCRKCLTARHIVPFYTRGNTSTGDGDDANARAIVRIVAAREQSLTRWLSNSRPWPITHVHSTMAKCRVVLALWSSGVGAA